jgi:hypothetical protein
MIYYVANLPGHIELAIRLFNGIDWIEYWLFPVTNPVIQRERIEVSSTRLLLKLNVYYCSISSKHDTSDIDVPISALSPNTGGRADSSRRCPIRESDYM